MPTTIDGLSDDEALHQIGMLIDTSSVAQSKAGTDRAFLLLEALQNRDLSAATAVLIHYFRANAWEARERASRDDQMWAWERPYHQEQILELRRAVTHAGFTELDAARQCQILTNLANQLCRIGRFCESLELWDRALTLNEKFGMANGNRGYGLSHYAQGLYDTGQASFMLVAAHDSLSAALAEDADLESQEARTIFEREARDIESRVDIATARGSFSYRHSLGKSDEERRYRSWCLSNRLFINPLNDLGPLSIAAQDVMTLPSTMQVPASSRPPGIVGFFNQMKQEFVSARYLYYEGAHANGVHFSDRDVLLYNTLDYPAYSLAAEKMRAAFRVTYSLFDKIAFFLNEYFSLDHNPQRVSFKSVWFEAKGARPRPLRQRFLDCQNWPLRGLFWLSKDLFEDDFKLVTQPDAAALNEIRNHLEHRYLQLHVQGLDLNDPDDDGRQLEPERISYSITADEFAAKTLRLLKLVRAALIYLSLAVFREEGARAKAKGAGRIVTTTVLDPWIDDWKQ